MIGIRVSSHRAPRAPRLQPDSAESSPTRGGRSETRSLCSRARLPRFFCWVAFERQKRTGGLRQWGCRHWRWPPNSFHSHLQIHDNHNLVTRSAEWATLMTRLLRKRHFYRQTNYIRWQLPGLVTNLEIWSCFKNLIVSSVQQEWGG